MTPTAFFKNINVWMGTLGNKIIGPILINKNLEGAIYFRDVGKSNRLMADAINKDPNLVLKILTLNQMVSHLIVFYP